MHVTAEVLTQLLEISPDALIVIDQAGKIEMANGQTEAMFGYRQVEVYLSQPSLVVDVDPGRVEQVLLNLIGNAIKYSPRGGSVIVKLWEEATEQAIHISVQGHGIGIPEHQQMQIFGRFIRAENAQAWGISGTGLGLYLSGELIEQHGGRLWFESEEDAGSSFFLTLPIICICAGSSLLPAAV